MKAVKVFGFALISFMFVNISSANDKPTKISWSEFLVRAKSLDLGVSEEQVRKLLGNDCFEKREHDKKTIQYSYSAFGGKEPNYKSTRAAKFVFMKDYKGDGVILSEIAFASYMMIGPPTE